ncbi:hypothetical protein [Fuerstiella marisgermanici]|uniref:Uncharacterized protein n=1 Tax=Fuerstiella marisgermanici TaxID=1891926 RepID=A0A1P8WM35_9PLAN|nr:hypothetical protein [Fuerstiella marisgermanici]APZ95107.1 hypothetical protein Fuma_04761 [Fuerstiella marisgermanici]
MSKLTSTIVTMALAVTVFSLSGSSAMAQFGNRIQQPFDRPAFSPYMNMFRNSPASGGAAIMNYYGLVRPQQEMIQQQNDLQQGLYGFQRQQSMQNGQRPGQRGGFPRSYRMGVTGHSVGFMTAGSRTQSGAGAGAGLAGFGQPSGGGAGAFGGSNSSGSQFNNDGMYEENSFSGGGGGSFSGHSPAFGYGAGYNTGGGF